MALQHPILFLFFAIIFHISHLALSAKERFDSDNVYQLGFGNDLELSNTNYINNVNSLLSDFVSESSLGFLNTSAGDVSSRAYGFYLCRGDLDAKKCNRCLKTVRQYFLDQATTLYYYEGFLINSPLRCVVHYANNSRTFAYRENTTLTGSAFGDDLARHPQYNTTLLNTLQELVEEAGYGNSTKVNFATRVVDLAGTQAKVYVLVQCAPDISAMNCSSCLRNLYSTFRPVSIGATVLGSNCLLKYNDESFFGGGFCSLPSYFHMILVLLLTVYITFI